MAYQVYLIIKYVPYTVQLAHGPADWLQSLKQFFINVSYHIYL